MPTGPAGYVAGRCSAPWTQLDPVIPVAAELAVFARCETTSHLST